MRHALLTTTAALLLAAAPVLAAPGGEVLPGQTRGDVGAQSGSWDGWYGCWRAVGDDGLPAGEAEEAGALVCVLPGADAQTARIANIEDGRIVEELSIRGDGQARAVAEGGCTGSESAMFSSDGRRVYTRADLDCRSFNRVSTGVIALVSDSEWIDAQAVVVSGQATGRTLRYRAVPASEVPASIAALLPQGQQLALQAVRLDAAAELDMDDVVEAAEVIGAPALEALLAAKQQGFSLDGRKLAQLDRAGVPASTIDVMVALSYPDRFAVRETRPSPEEAAADPRYGGRSAALDEYCDYMYRSARRTARRNYHFGVRDECYPYGSGFGLDSYRYGNGYGYGGYHDPRWGYGTPVVIVPTQQAEAPPRGGTVSRDGYTRGDVSPRGRAVPRSSTTRSRPAASTGSSARSAPPASSNPPASPTRRAKPRPPGGGGGDGGDGGRDDGR